MNYLALIFSSPQYPENLRTHAGVNLKKKLSKIIFVPDGTPPKGISEHQINHLKSCFLKSLSDSFKTIRSTGSNIISTIVSKTGYQVWEELIPDLISLLNYSDDAKIGAFRCLYLICEDCVDELENSESNPLDTLVPVLIKYFEHPDLKWKIESIRVYSALLVSFPSAVLKNMSNFLNALTGLASIDNPSIRKHICSCFVILLDRPKYFDQVFPNVVEYVLACSAHSDEMVAQEASKFWMTLSEVKALVPWLSQLRPYLPRLVPLILKGTIYSEFERKMKEEDSMAPSKESEINPSTLYVGSKFHGDVDKNDEDDEEEEELIDDDDVLNELDEIWNLRKFSAQTLDYMSQHFGEEFLPHLLPHIENYLKDGNPWYIRESGVLALGAVKKGCGNYMAKYLPHLIPYLMSIATNEGPTLRSVAIWSISKFSDWIADQKIEDIHSILKLYIVSMTDGNKKVQEASTSALCTLLESTGDIIAPFVGNIVDSLEKCLTLYKNKSLLIVFDAIGTLSESAPTQIANPNYVSKIIPKMLQIWQSMKMDDKRMFPLMSSLSVFCSNIGPCTEPYAQAIVLKSAQMIQIYYTLIQENNINRGEAKQFIVSALDLICGVINALPEKSAIMLANEEFFKMIHVCLTDKNNDVKQTALGLLGDMAKGGIQTLRVGLPKFMPIIVDNLLSTSPGIAANASWSLMEISYSLKSEILQYLDINVVIQSLTKILMNNKAAMSVVENASVAVGILVGVCPLQILPHADSFFEAFCYSVSRVQHDEERDRAYRGLCEFIRHNNQLAVTYFPCVCDAAAFAKKISDETKSNLRNILSGVKMAAGVGWNQYFSQLDPNVRKALTNIYGL